MFVNAMSRTPFAEHTTLVHIVICDYQMYTIPTYTCISTVTPNKSYNKYVYSVLLILTHFLKTKIHQHTPSKTDSSKHTFKKQHNARV